MKPGVPFQLLPLLTPCGATPLGLRNHSKRHTRWCAFPFIVPCLELPMRGKRKTRSTRGFLTARPVLAVSCDRRGKVPRPPTTRQRIQEVTSPPRHALLSAKQNRATTPKVGPAQGCGRAPAGTFGPWRGALEPQPWAGGRAGGRGSTRGCKQFCRVTATPDRPWLRTSHFLLEVLAGAGPEGAASNATKVCLRTSRTAARSVLRPEGQPHLFRERV